MLHEIKSIKLILVEEEQKKSLKKITIEQKFSLEY